MIDKIIELYKKYNGDIPNQEVILRFINIDFSSIVLRNKDFRLIIYKDDIIISIDYRMRYITDKDQYFNYSLQYNLPKYEEIQVLMSTIIENKIRYIFDMDQ